jgi:phage terminase small subunit
MPRGRPPKPVHLHIVQNTYRPDRHSKRKDALRPQQHELLKLAGELEGEARQIYAEVGTAAWWLTAADHAGIVAYSVAYQQHAIASSELGKCLRDPAFANPASQAHRAAKLYVKIADQAANRLLQWADCLALTPRSRQRLGIDPSKPPPGPEPDDDPWKQLRLLRKPPAS